MSFPLSFNNHKNEIIGEELGTVSVSMYKEVSTGLPFFCVTADNDDVMQLSYVIEDTLYNF